MTNDTFVDRGTLGRTRAFGTQRTTPAGIAGILSIKTSRKLQIVRSLASEYPHMPQVCPVVEPNQYHPYRAPYHDRAQRRGSRPGFAESSRTQ
jgi:hypothetical protein